MDAPEGGDAAVWKVIQETNGRWDEEEQTGQCLWLGLGAGALKCHWYMDDGLNDERQELLRLLDPQSGGKSCPVGSHFKSPASNTGMDWEVDCERLVGSTHGQEVIALTSDGEEKPFKFTTNTDAVFYTIYARLVGELMTASGACKQDASSKDCLDRGERFRVVVKPEESDIFTLPDNHRFNPDQFPRLSVSAAREVDRELAVYQDCTDSDVDEPPDYQKCDEGSMGLLERARTFTDDQHRSDGPVVVQNGTALVWGGLHSSALLSSSIPAWAAAGRREDDVFVRSLLNFTQRCRDGVARHAVCLGQSVETTDIEGNPVQKLRSINPWVGGEWNPYEGCDTDMLPLRGESTLQEVFDNYCSDRVCPDETSSPFYTRMPAPGGGTDLCYGTAAKRSRTQVVDQLTVSREAASNLCYRAPRRPPGCPHVQGMLGGLRGSRVVSLYSESAAVPHADHRSILAQGRGLFVHGGNPVYFTGKGSEEEVATATHHGILRMHRDDLGGHHVVMLVSADGQMVVDRVPLGATDGPARQAHTAAQNSVFYSRQSGATHGDSGWRHNLARTLAFEDALVISVVYPRNAAERSQQDWSCPLRRIGFWNRIETADFDPLIPSPMRTERLFGGELQMLYGTRAHPTTRAARAQTLHSLHTSNGFCFCESAAGCTVPAAERDGLCGLVDTIRSVLDEQDRDVRDLDSTMCPDQLDWPFTAGDLRDGMRTEGRPEAGQQASCNFLDRLPKFRYSYRSGDVQDNPSGATTLSPGGVCHMGRASGGVPPGSGVVATTCRSVHKNATHLRVRCDDDTSGALKDVLLERRSSAVPQELLSAMRGRRRRCQGGCTPPPRFYDHTGANELPHGPEASYGLPFRWSAARLLAADVRAAACGEPVGVGNNPECQALMDVPTWTLQGFLDALFQDPQSLFLQPLGNASGAPLVDEVAAGGRPDEDLLWDGPDAAWVLCDPGRGRCYGKIPREEWMDPAQRMGACKRVMRENEEVLGDLARGINLCDMNDRLNSLCQVLQHARQMVIDANCLVAGGCTETEFLYSPASFSQVNNDFSSSVMRDFYELHNPGTSPDAKVCPGDPEDQQLRADSALQTQHCASREMGRLHLALHAVRMVAHLLVEGMAYSLNLVLTLCRFLLMSGASDSGRLALEDELAFWWNKLVDLIDGAMRQISDLVFEVVFENGLGEELYDLIEELCRGVNSVWTWLHSFKKMLADLIAGFLLNVSSALQAVGMGVQGVDGAIDAVRAWGDEFTPINCGSVGNSRDREEVGAALPIATRCWAQFDRTLDSSNPLSCTRADTCRNPSIAFGQSTLQYGAIDASSGAPISCGQCPITDATMASFGCNTVTKFCSCGVRPTSRTACLSHGECALPSAGCSLKSDFTTSDSSGGLQCHLCDDAPVCLVTNGDSGPGQCVCPIQAFHPVACVYQGEANPSADSLCAVDMGGSLSTSISGSEELVWSTLAVAPCAISGPAFCYEVSGHGRLAVANGVNPTDPLRGAGRRLLLQGGYDPLLHGGEEDPLDVQDELDQSILAFEGWNSTAAPCSTLVFAHLRAPESLGIMDLDRLKSCVYWRRVANESIYRNNLTALEDHTALLLSLADFSSALSHKGVPEALLFDGLGFWADVVLASPWLRPAVSVLRVGALRLQAVLSDMDPRVPRPAWALMLSRALRSVQDPGASEETSTFVISQLRTMGELQPLSFSPPPNATRRPTGAGGDDDPATSISGIHASASRTRDAHRGSAPQRRLLTSLPDDVSQYSALTAAIQGFSDVPVGDRVASLWTQGPLGWPPDFSRMFNSSEDDCAVGSAVLDVLTGTFRVLDVFYRRDLTQKLRPVPFNLSAQIPSMPDAPDGKAGLPGGQGRLGRPGDWASSAMDFLSVGVLQGVLGVSPGQVAATLSSPEGIRGMLHELVACDFESVTLCSRRQRNLLVSLLLVLFLFFAGSALLGAVGLGFLQGALLLSIPSMVIYTAYGVSPMCLPQVPTCLLDDLLYTIGTVLPGKIDWPNSLQVYDGCLGPTWIEQERALAQGLPRPYSAPRSDLPGVRNGTVDCLLRCDAAPFSFAGWEANAAWIVCGLTPSTCAGLEIPYFPRFREAAGNYSAVLSRGVQDEMDGYAVCNGFTLVWVLPYVFLAMGGVFFLLSALSLPLQVATALVQLLVQGLGYTHAGPGD